MEGMFDENGELLAGWYMNDAHWRGEYMNGLLEALGHEIVRVDSCDARKKADKALIKKLKEHFGV